MSDSYLRAPAADGEARIDPEVVRRYFEGTSGVAESASYMAHERDLPLDVVHYRLRREREAIADWLDEVPAEGQVLDVGCGAGAWSAFFAQRFGAVVAIDQSRAMCQAASRTLAGRRGVTVRCADVRTELAEGPFDLAFLGGVCMYLDDADVLRLLTTLRGRLAANGFAVLRESTVPAGTRRAEGRYQAIYRSVARYRELFSAAGYDTVSVKRNAAYTAMSVAADLVVARRRLFSLPAAGSRAAAALTWWGLRAVAPASFVALPWLLERMGIAWPPLQNHFFRIAVSP